jgi:uracil-DNA glycosylase
MSHSPKTFLSRLAGAQVGGPVFNQYAATEQVAPTEQFAATVQVAIAQANAIRRANLTRYLEQMAALLPSLLLVGEAPGYRGCRLTGVPFTSEAIILDDRRPLFGRRAGYQKTAETTRLTKEASATMLWSALSGLWPPPLLWNAFPFHPHRPDQPLSNRRPLKSELLLGLDFLSALLALFPLVTVAAVGQTAAAALSLAGLSNFPVLRHPSHGGKAAFCAGLQEITVQG